jgi:predicted PurR-regulated permease PerM
MDIPTETGPDRAVGGPKLRSFALVGSFAILTCASLYFARDLIVPLVLALLIYLTLMPLVRFLSLRGIPEFVSATVLVVAIALGVGGAVMMLSDPFMQLINDAPRIVDDVKAKLNIVRRPVEALIEAGKQVEELARERETTVEVTATRQGLLSWAAGTVVGLVTMSGVTLVLIVLLLSSGDLFLQKLVRVMPTLTDKKKALRIVHDIEGEVSRYLLTITLINSCLGVLIGGCMALLGMPQPALWGIVAALLNFIPYIGAAAGILSVTAVAIVSFPTLSAAVLPPLAYLVVNVIENNLVTPLILGRRLELNAVVILVALAFWGWLWGIVGTLMAVPLLVVTKVFCDHFPGLSGVGEFLSGQPPPVTDERPEAEKIDQQAVSSLPSD